jgi:Zn-dependent alcohol dehydrogenase
MFRQILRLIENGLVAVDDLVSARWPLERTGEAFQSVMRASGLKHVVSFEGR